MRLTTSFVRIGVLAALLAIPAGFPAKAALPTTAGDTNTPIARVLINANKLFEEKNWAEARAAFDSGRAMDQNWSTQSVRLAVEGAVACSLKLEQ